MKRTFILLLFGLSFLGSAFAQSEQNTPLRITLYDYPFNHMHEQINVPSMRQSLDLTMSFYNYAHEKLTQIAISDQQAYWYNILFDIIWVYLPPGTSWLHEEYHRAVLSSEKIDSYNEVYKLAFSDVISVSHLTDDELTRFKKENNPSFVRMSAAGMEAQLDMNMRINQDHFFLSGPHNQFNQLLNTVNVSAYMYSCMSSDDRIDEIIKEDGDDMAKRDFTGFDCLAWTYDLSRPDEAYSNRGAHPSGVGIDRYIKYSDLTRSERNYLGLNAALSLLNFVNPMMYGYLEFGTSEKKWNYSLSHYMTSFGHSVDINGFFKDYQNKFQLSLHNYFNKARQFPGLEVIVFDHPLNVKWSSDLRAMLWSQPKEQSFYAKTGELGGLVSSQFKYEYSPGHFPFIEIEQKSQGWVAGNVYLEPAFSTRLGYLLYY